MTLTPFRAGLLCMAVVVADAAAQPPGTRPPGSFSGARPGIGGSNIGGPPVQRPGGGLVGGPGMPAGPRGFGGMETVYTCPTCRREVARGHAPPASVSCCGKTYVNGVSLNGVNPPPGGGEGIGPGVPPSEPQPQPQDNAPPPGFGQQPPVFAAPPPAAPPPSGNGVLIAVGAGIVLVGLAILGGVAFLVINGQRNSKPRRRRRPRERDRDYD